VLAEAGRFASEEIAPLNRVGDIHGSQLQDGAVVTPPGWQEAYRNWREAGWNGINAPESFGGQGLPLVLAAATQEMWTGACMSFALCPLLTMGAVEALQRHGTESLRATYLEKIVSGEWTATMNLTEPQAGSDVGALTTRAEPQGDGTYRLFGQKIFITMASTISRKTSSSGAGPPARCALRAAAASRCSSSRRRWSMRTGRLGERNDSSPAGLEEKMGIHGSPTCTMVYGDGRFGSTPGAVGWLVGEENRGLACMFTMMNNAR
jgi:alkylation response protein AidB-like acyl-CoA dehydrogenase